MKEQEFYQLATIHALGALIRNSGLEHLTFSDELTRRSAAIVSDAEAIAEAMRQEMRKLGAFEEDQE